MLSFSGLRLRCYSFQADIIASTSIFMASLLKRSHGPGTRISATTRLAPKRAHFIRQNSSTVSESSKDTITWPEYLEIRRGKHRWETVYCSHFPQDCYVLMPFYSDLDHPFLSSRPGGWSRVLWISRDGCDQTDHGEPPIARHAFKVDADGPCIRELTPCSFMGLVQWRARVSQSKRTS